MKKRTPLQVAFDAMRQRGAELVARAYPGAFPATKEEIAADAVRLQREAEADLKSR